MDKTLSNFGIVFIGMAFYFCEKRRVSDISSLTKEQQKQQEEDALHLLFKISDSDNSGYVEPSELCLILDNLGWEVTSEQAMHAVVQIHEATGIDDPDKTTTPKGGFCMYEEQFVTAMTRLEVVVELVILFADVVRLAASCTSCSRSSTTSTTKRS